MDQSVLLTDSRQILCHHYGIFCHWVAKVPPRETLPWSGKEQGEMAVFTGYSEKLQSNAWGEMGGYVDRVSADSVNQYWAMGCPNYERSQQQPLSSVPKVVIVERFNCLPWKSKRFAQSSISYFLFSGRREYQRLIVLNWVGADLQMFKSGSNNIDEQLKWRRS